MSLHCPNGQLFDTVCEPVLPYCGFVLTELVVVVLADLKRPMPYTNRQERKKLTSVTSKGDIR